MQDGNETRLVEGHPPRKVMMPPCAAMRDDDDDSTADLVGYLMDRCDVRQGKSTDGVTAPLTAKAPKVGNVRVVRHLVAWGIDNGATPLYAAAENGHVAIVKYLVEQGANKDKADRHGQSPLFVAAERGHLAVVQYLVEHGAEKDKADVDGVTPLQIALSAGRTEVAEYLRSAGCS